MTVEFDLFFFTREFILAVKEKEQKKGGTIGEKEIAFELGAISCRNAGRKQPIFFYDIDELTELIESGYIIGSTRPTDPGDYELPEFDPTTVIQVKVELDGELQGNFIDPQGSAIDFSNRDELTALIQKSAPTIGEL